MNWTRLLPICLLAITVRSADHDGDGSDDSDERDYTCTEYKRELQQCMAAELDVPDLEHHFSILNPFRPTTDLIDPFCDDMADLRKCANDLMEGAVEDRVEDCQYMQDTIMMLHVVKYACEDGKEVFTTQHKCLRESISVENSQVVEECMEVAITDLHGDTEQDAQYHDHDVEEEIKGPERCELQSLVADCVADKARELCGSAAGDFIVEMKKSLKPKLWLAWDCGSPQEATHSDNFSPAHGVSVWLLICLVVFLCTEIFN